MSNDLIVIIGAGVIGLSTAIALLEEGTHKNVIIVAELSPLDPKNIRYTSQWAGAHHVSVAVEENQHKLDADTFLEMEKLLKDDPDIPLMYLPQTEYRTTPYPVGGDIQFNLLSRYSPNYRKLDSSELPPGVTYGAAFSTIYIDSPNYLLYLFAKFKSLGGIYHQELLSTLPSILSLSVSTPSGSTILLSTASLIINASGIGAFTLVNDKKVFPTRGQTVLVRSPWVKFGITQTGKPGEGIYTYIIPRKSGDIIIGGTADVGDWEGNCREETSEMIMRRGIALCPELLPEDKRAEGRIEDLDVIEFGCGFRPSREGGLRIEIDQDPVVWKGKEVKLIHCYGHAGYGYQSSWGSAFKVVRLAKEVL